MAEADTSYYGIPKPEVTERWAGRTPPGFLFDIKSFSLFTNHPTRPVSLPPDLRAELPDTLRAKSTLYVEQLPPELVDEAWERFRAALEPLRVAGRIGAVFFQFPRWFLPSSRSLAYVEQVQERMYGFQIAVEFRKIEWLDARHLDGTLAFLRSRDIPYVAVDTPQGHDSSMPALHEVTSSKLAVVRFHGRNHETWDLRNAPPTTGSARCASRYGSTITSRRGNLAVLTIALATHHAGYCGPIGASVSAKNPVSVLAG